MRSIMFITLVSALALTGTAQAGGYGTHTYQVERPSISRHVYRHYSNDDYCPTPVYRPHHRHRPSYYNYDNDDSWTVHHRPGRWSFTYRDND